MKLAILATLFAAASAFTVAPAAKTSTSLRVNELEIGVTDPLGVFDPLGWLETQPEAFERRIAMVAVVGMLVHNAGIEIPGSLTLDGSVKFAEISDGFTGLFEVPALGLAQILLGTGLMELVTWPASDYSGDYGTGYLGRTLEGEELKFKLDMELNQGRAAMLGIFGAMIGEGIQGQTFAEHIAGGGKILIPGLF